MNNIIVPQKILRVFFWNPLSDQTTVFVTKQFEAPILPIRHWWVVTALGHARQYGFIAPRERERHQRSMANEKAPSAAHSWFWRCWLWGTDPNVEEENIRARSTCNPMTLAWRYSYICRSFAAFYRHIAVDSKCVYVSWWIAQDSGCGLDRRNPGKIMLRRAGNIQGGQ